MDALDLEMLELIARLGHVLSSQLHRRFNPGRAVTTTQRRLKRLSDAAFVERLQLYGREGGGGPMCYVISDAGRELLGESGNRDRSIARSPAAARNRAVRGMPAWSDDARLRLARRDVHIAGWVLALVELAGDRRPGLRGREESVLSPPRAGSVASTVIGPAQLHLPGGRVPHDFVRRSGIDRCVEVMRFETIRPDVTIELAGHRLDVMIEFEDRLAGDGGVALLHRYDHFLTGWSAHVSRYDERGRATPLVVFVCRDRSRAIHFSGLADRALVACRAYPGEYPHDWDYSGRSRILFASERDAHEGLMRAYGVPRVPPAVRIARGGADPGAGECPAELRNVLDVA
jgi:hypothetical protein